MRKDWVAAAKWVEGHPEEADHLYEYENGSKRYPLLEALQRDPS